MDVKLIKDIILYINKINKIPAILIEDEKIFWSTYRQDYLNDDAARFYLNLDKTIKFYSYNDNELFFTIPLFDRYMLVLGGVFIKPPINLEPTKTSFTYIFKKEYLKEMVLTAISISEEDFIEYCSIIYKLIFNKEFDLNLFDKQKYQSYYLNDSQVKYVFDLREQELSPYVPEAEKKLLEFIKLGDVEKSKKINLNFISNPTSINVSYLFKIVSLVTLATRAAVEGGADIQSAYGLSDLFLERLGVTHNNNQVYSIAKEVLPSFASLVAKELDRKKEANPHLLKAKRYINTHLHYPLTLEDIATEVGVNVKYLSRLFVLYEKEKCSHYINRKRIEEACDLILSTDKSLSDIALALSFSTQSYFIKIFKEIKGCTPLEFKNSNKIN